MQVGDWGRDGTRNQSQVAAVMGRVGALLGPLDFVVSTGDNFYESGLTSPGDPQFDSSFSHVYTAASLQVSSGVP
jgi:tartrate-resistant acid phosphatase type 5